MIGWEANRRHKISIGRLTVGLAASAVFGHGAFAADSWYPVPVKVWSAPHKMTGASTEESYVPLPKASKKWNVCVSVPHVKDGYYLALVYGLEQEAKALGVSLQVVEAGGYTLLGKQISQIEDCVSGGADAVAVVAISADGLNNIAGEIVGRGVPFLTFSNAITSDAVVAQTQISWSEMGTVMGKALIESALGEKGPQKVAWLPGPAGASWVEDTNTAFKQVIQGSNLVITDTKYGDTGKEAQLKLIEDAVQADPDLKYIVGNAVAAEAAVGFLRERGLLDKIKVVSDYLTPGVYDAVKKGEVALAMSDATVLQSRIIVDQAVRVLEKKDYFRNISPQIITLNKDSVKTIDPAAVLAPEGYKPVFNVE